MDAVKKAILGEVLEEGEAYEVMRALMAGEVSPVRAAGLLVAMSLRGERPHEIAAMARAMREAARPLRVARRPLLDIVGTGGDHKGLLNLSTLAALVAAAGGVAVAKHGNRAASSRAGSADLLEALGVDLEAPPERVGEAIEELGFGFLFARVFHPAMRHVAPVRAELGVRTVFNLLGPLTNPAGADAYVLGVFSPEWLSPMAEALERLGARGLVVHGEGADELVLGENRVVEVGKGAYTLTPEEVGLKRAPLEALKGGGPEENAALARRLLKGEEKGPLADAVALAAGAGFYAAGKTPSLKEGVGLAREVLASGEAYLLLERYVAFLRA
ncbi:anthranilate phosphoribosyltransferase [Thermus thermophilus]|uniref:Anthranilate phosphoribosyltransferase n=1 Tax=Thermus thermophilus JL-18 TaxID=798128 RepID=H9ZTZ1_THETH|nr:anthranilate phosphoribosyltransferase [Thermus thermophilus]AFH39801.1 anthranilate phosphoribosyltransferase [Thermus thermophilus JL-18]